MLSWSPYLEEEMELCKLRRLWYSILFFFFFRRSPQTRGGGVCGSLVKKKIFSVKTDVEKASRPSPDRRPDG